MTPQSPPTSKGPYLHMHLQAPSRSTGVWPPGAALKRYEEALLIIASLLSVALIGLLDCGTESNLSFSILYLLAAGLG